MAENEDNPDRNLTSSNKTTQSSSRGPSSESESMPNGQKLKHKLTYSYSRDEMLKIRENKLSRTRPTKLSEEFNNEEGLFSPDKWLQHRWECEGVENKKRGRNSATVTGANAQPVGGGAPKMLSAIMEAAANNTIGNNSSNSELDQQMFLSPQRRGFALGCRAASSANDEEKQPSTKSRWRQTNGADFKPAFQKSALEANNRHSSRSGSSQSNASANVGNGMGWTQMGGGQSAKHHGWDKHRRGGERTRSSNTENEPVPEWMEEGPTSHLEVIELKGFDDDPGGATNGKNQRRTRPKGGKEQSVGPKTSNNNNHAGSCEKSSAADRVEGTSNARQKRHSGGDIKNCSRPASRQTPIRSVGDSHASSPPQTARFIQASDLESSIIKEQQEKIMKQQQHKEKGESNSKPVIDVFAALGIQPSKAAQQEEEAAASKLPNSDAEFAAYILGVPTNKISKPVHGATIINNSSTTSSVVPVTTTTPPQEPPPTSRLSRFFAKTTTADGVAEQKTPANDQLDGQQLPRRQSCSPPSTNNFQSFQPQSHRPASAEQHQQLAVSASSPFNPSRHLSPIQYLATSASGGIQQQQNKLTGMLLGQSISPGPADLSIQRERESLLQQMRANSGNFIAPQHFPSSSQSQQMQQHQAFMEQFRKRVSPIMALQGGQQPPPRPSSGEHANHHGMLASPVFLHQQQQRQSPLNAMPPPPSSINGTGAGFSTAFQHLLFQTARRMMPNPNMQPAHEQIQAAYYELCKDPKVRAHLMMGGHLMAANNTTNNHGNPVGAAAAFGSGSFPLGNPSPFQSHQQAFFGGSGPPGAGPHFAAAYNNHGGMPHHQFGGVGFAPPLHGPNPPPHFVGGHGAMSPAFFQQHHQQQYPGINFPPPSMFNNSHQQQPMPMAHHQKSNSFNPTHHLLNTPAFMPTSVMRQMSKMPTGAGGGGTSVASGGGGGPPDLSSSTSNPQSIFLQKLFGSDMKGGGGGRAILGRDPIEELPRNMPRIGGCLKLEDIERRELAAYQKQSAMAAANNIGTNSSAL